MPVYRGQPISNLCQSSFAYHVSPLRQLPSSCQGIFFSLNRNLVCGTWEEL